MKHYPESIREVIHNLSRLPGIGEKTAERLTLFLLRAPRKDVEALARSIAELQNRSRVCNTCFGFSDQALCGICADISRDATRLCVVEQAADMAAIEKAGAFHGYYHILQGVLSPLDGIGPESLRIRELWARLQSGTVREVVLATGTSVEGEATAAYLSEELHQRQIAVSRIASGIPMGGDLKYVDQVTLKRAMDTRHAF